MTSVSRSKAVATRVLRVLAVVCVVLSVVGGAAIGPVGAQSSYINETQQSASGSLAPGGSDSITVGGVDKPTNASLTISGETTTSSGGSTVTQYDGSDSFSVSPGGSLEPTNAQIVVESTGSTTNTIGGFDNQKSVSYTSAYTETIDVSGYEELVVSGTFEAYNENYDIDMEVLIDGSVKDSHILENYNYDGSDAPTYDFYATADVSGQSTAELEILDNQGFSTDWKVGNVDYEGTKSPSSISVSGDAGSATLGSGGSASLDQLTTGSQTISTSWDGGSGTSVTFGVDWTERNGVEDPSVSVGSSTVSHNGVLDGSVTETVDLSTGSNTIDASYAGSGLSYDLSWTERSLTEAGEPQLSNATPTGGAGVYDTPNLSVDVATPAFDVIGSVEIGFYQADGTLLGTDNVTENTTASIQHPNPVSGSNEWYAKVEGAGSDQTATNEFRTPATLEIRDEQQPDTLITNSGSSEVRFYTSGAAVYTRSPSNGKIDLTGLPADETFVASVSIDGYGLRTITINSLLEQQTVYLLDKNASAAEVDFELNDQTNQFPPDQTTLFVERAITRNNATSWRTIVGERFGATGTVPTTLAAGDRYRLKVRNRDGDMRALGSYVAAGAAVEPLRIGQVTFQGAQDSGASFSSRFDSTSESEAVDLRYVDPSGDTDELNVTVRRQDANNTVVFQDSISGPIDSYRERIPTSALPGHTDDSSYTVEYSAARAGSARPVSGNRTIGDVPSVATDWPIDPQFLNIAGYLTILALFGAMVILSPRHAGLVGSATAFALSIMGVIAINSLVLSFALVVSGLFAVGGES